MQKQILDLNRRSERQFIIVFSLSSQLNNRHYISPFFDICCQRYLPCILISNLRTRHRHLVISICWYNPPLLPPLGFSQPTQQAPVFQGEVRNLRPVKEITGAFYTGQGFPCLGEIYVLKEGLFQVLNVDTNIVAAVGLDIFCGQNFVQNKRFLQALPVGRISHFTSRIYPSLGCRYSYQNGITWLSSWFLLSERRADFFSFTTFGDCYKYNSVLPKTSA